MTAGRGGRAGDPGERYPLDMRPTLGDILGAAILTLVLVALIAVVVAIALPAPA